jgi:hypothetical protein
MWLSPVKSLQYLPDATVPGFLDVLHAVEKRSISAMLL